MSRTFVRSSSHVLDGGSANPVTAYPFTIVCWINPTIVDRAWRGIISQGHFSTNVSGFWLDMTSGAGSPNDTKVQMSLADTGGNADIYSSSALASGSFQHLGVVCTSSTVDFYIGGSLDVSRSHSQAFAASSNHNLFVGAENDGSNSSAAELDAELAELAIYSVALTAGEIAGMAAVKTSPLATRLNNLAGYWQIQGLSLPESDFIAKQNLEDISPGAAPAKSTHPPMTFPRSKVLRYAPIAPTVSGRIMSSLAHHGGLAGRGGIAGIGGGLAG